jgi:hypothetical protein
VRLLNSGATMAERTMTSDDFESALGKFRSEAAAEILRQAIRNLETKFDPNQPRAPVGSSNGGQWVDTGQGGGSPSIHKPAKLGVKPKVRRLVQAARFLASHPGAAPIIQAVALPALAGGVALTRAIGDFDHQTTGREKTPFLNLPTEKLDLTITASAPGKRSQPFERGATYPIRSKKAQKEKNRECDQLEQEDLATCKIYGIMYGRDAKETRRIKERCYATMNVRQVQCRLGNGVESVNINLFSGRR